MNTPFLSPLPNGISKIKTEPKKILYPGTQKREDKKKKLNKNSDFNQLIEGIQNLITNTNICTVSQN